MGGFDGYVHNLEGNKVISTRVRSRDLIAEQTTDRLKTMKISFPQAKVGSILEITYTITSPFFYSPPDWQFQYSIPVAYSEYILYQPAFYNFNFFVQGYQTMKDHTTTPNMPRPTYHWEVVDRNYIVLPITRSVG